jgi:hypothetical protein
MRRGAMTVYPFQEEWEQQQAEPLPDFVKKAPKEHSDFSRLTFDKIPALPHGVSHISEVVDIIRSELLPPSQKRSPDG